MKRITSVLVAALLAVLLVCVAHAQQQRPSALPLDPINAIFEAFKTHDIVALGEGEHGNEQGFAFRLALLRDPRFPSVVNDIVVETGNALYQDVMDRFIAGQAVPAESPRRIWQNTTQPFTTFDIPIYEQFFRAVRAVNQGLPRDRQIRVLLGDPPIDWTQVRSPEDARKWLGERDTYPADLIQREVIAKHRHALVIYGDIHFQRENMAFNYVDNPKTRSIVGLLEHATSPVKVFSIWTNTSADMATMQPDIANWPTPSLTSISGTTLGAHDFTEFYSLQAQRLRVQGDGSFAPIPHSDWTSRNIEQQFDAVLYIGPPSTITYAKLSPTLCADQAYLTMRFERFALVGLPAGTEQLKKFCAEQGSQQK